MKNKKNRSSSLREPSGQHTKNRITKYKHGSTPGVKWNSPSNPPRPKQGFRMLHLVVRHAGRDEFIYRPACARCSGPILDLTMGNISVWNEVDDFSLTPLHYSEDDHCSDEYRYVGTEVFLAKGQVYAFHKDCDNSPSGSAWTSSANVFKTDQRYEFEKDEDSHDAESTVVQDVEETE